MTEQENKKQYESFVTSCIHGGQFDMIVSYKEWLHTIQSYTPQLPQNDEEYIRFYDAINRLNKATTISVSQLKKVLKND